MNESPVIAVFGATGGIGAAVSRNLAAAGRRLLLCARTPERVTSLAAELGAQGSTLDATRFAEVEAVTKEALRAYGRIDGVVNCVGSLLLKPAHLTSEQEFAETVAANLTSAFAVLRASAKAMLTTGGSIVLLSSAAARVGLMNHDAIAAAKAGVAGLALSAAATYARQRIRVNCVSPGLVRTPLTARLTSNEAVLKASTAMHALGRVGEPDEVASAIVWLLDSRQSWVTGQVIGVDGGLGSVRPPAAA